jgi:hypothetical protein
VLVNRVLRRACVGKSGLGGVRVLVNRVLEACVCWSIGSCRRACVLVSWVLAVWRKRPVKAAETFITGADMGTRACCGLQVAVTKDSGSEGG